MRRTPLRQVCCAVSSENILIYSLQVGNGSNAFKLHHQSQTFAAQTVCASILVTQEVLTLEQVDADTKIPVEV